MTDDLARAEAQAAALLAELEAKDAANDVAAGLPKYEMPSPYAPGEGPRDPRKSVAAPGGQVQLNDALNSMFKPADPDTIRKPTNTSTHTVNFAQKIRDAQKYHGSH